MKKIISAHMKKKLKYQNKYNIIFYKNKTHIILMEKLICKSFV